MLSAFAGAARELTDALIVNPYAIDERSRTLAEALKMSDEEPADRMREMSQVVAEVQHEPMGRRHAGGRLHVSKPIRHVYPGINRRSGSQTCLGALMNDADIVDYQQSEGSISHPHSQESGDASIRNPVATVLDSILRWSSQRFFTRIRVSPMSIAWLRMHEGEYCKHSVEG